MSLGESWARSTSVGKPVPPPPGSTSSGNTSRKWRSSGWGRSLKPRSSRSPPFPGNFPRCTCWSSRTPATPTSSCGRCARGRTISSASRSRSPTSAPPPRRSTNSRPPGKKPPSRAGRSSPCSATRAGNGTTTIAANLADALSRYHGKKVVLVDLVLVNGDVTLFFNVTPDYSILDLAQERRSRPITTSCTPFC